MRISCYPTGEDADWTEALELLRAAIRTAPSAPLPAADLKAWKNRILAQATDALATPGGTVDMVVMRYAFGKYLVTRYSENIASIEADKVRDMLKVLSTGARVELIDR